MITKEDIEIHQTEPNDAEKQNGNAIVLTAIVGKVWRLPVGQVTYNSPYWDKMEAEACVDLTNQVLVDVYNEAFQLPRELLETMRRYKDELPDEVIGAAEVLKGKMSDMLIQTKR